MRALIESADRTQAMRTLMLLTGVGWVGAGTLVMELFGWRELANRRQLASLAGLVPAPSAVEHARCPTGSRTEPSS